MSSLDVRRTLEEVLIRYEFEPTLNDIYVEGNFDKDCLSCCFQSVGIKNRIIYEIDVIDLPAELLSKYHLTNGNKQRVIALARELSQLPNHACKCLVDRDLDHWIGNLDKITGLVWTQYSAIELCFFIDELIESIIITAAKAKISNFNKFLSTFRKILHTLYALRLADKQLGYSISWIGFNKYISAKDSELVFRQAQYIDALLHKSNQFTNRTTFLESFTKWESTLHGDERLYIRGHDFVQLLAYSISIFSGVKALASPDSIERVLVLLSEKAPSLLDGLI